ncbi:MAG: pilus assembly protein TadG-related protein [Isosphaeraceae bacterium]
MVLFGMMLPVFIGFVALAVDVSMIAVARNQLSTAADAAALAGAQQLASENRVRGTTDLAAEMTAANNLAQSFAQANRVLGAAPVVSTNPYNSATGQIQVGYLDLSNPSSSLDTSSSNTAKFNSVQVRAVRDASHGGPVPTIFGRVLGHSGSDVTVQSTASVQVYAVKGFKSSGSFNSDLLPITMHIDTWNRMLKNDSTTGDKFTFDKTTNTVVSGPDSIHESVLYPVDAGLAGNWGTLNVGVKSNSTSVLGAQIRYGITPAQLATFTNSTIALDTTKTPPSITFTGDPGISAGIKDDLTAIIGQPRSIPIYDQNGGNGNNAWYRVIAFQPARIVAVNFQGSNKYVIIQPCLTKNPTAVTGNVQPWTSGGKTMVFLSR